MEGKAEFCFCPGNRVEGAAFFCPGNRVEREHLRKVFPGKGKLSALERGWKAWPAMKPPESTRDSGNCNVIGFTTYVKSVLGLLQDRILCIASLGPSTSSTRTEAASAPTTTVF